MTNRLNHIFQHHGSHVRVVPNGRSGRSLNSEQLLQGLLPIRLAVHPFGGLKRHLKGQQFLDGHLRNMPKPPVKPSQRIGQFQRARFIEP